MIGAMRAFSRSKWALVLFGLLIASFFLFSGNDPLPALTGQRGFVAVGDRSLTQRDVSRGLDRYIEGVREQTGEVLTQKDAAQRGIAGAIINELTQQEILLAYAEKIGARASTEAVAAILAEAPRFKDTLGRYSIDEVARYASEEGYAGLEEFQEDFRDSLTLDYVRNALLAGLATPEIFTKPLAGFLGEQRQLSLARLPPDAAPSIPAADDATLEAYFKANAEQFRQPERRALSLLTYSAADFTDKVEIAEADLTAEYERRKKSFSTPETRAISQITGPTAKAVQDVVDLVKQDVPLADAIKRVAGVAVAQLSVSPADITETSYSDVIFGLPEGEIYGPLDVKGVFYGVQVDKVTPGVPTPFEQVRDQLREELASKEAERLYDATDEAFYDLVTDGAPLEQIAQEVGAPVISYAPVDARGLVKGGTEPIAAARDAKLLQGAFNGRAGELGEVGDVNGSRSVVRIDAIAPGRLPDWKEIRADVEAAWRAETQAAAIVKVSDDMAAAVNAGESFAAAAAKLKMAAAQPSQPFMRANPAGLDPAVLEAAFKLEPGKASRVTDQGGNPWVIRVESVKPIPAELATQLQEQVANEVRNSLGSDIQQVFLQSAQKSLKVKTNDKAIAAYLNRFKEEAQ